ncbi:hypothetical protein [Paenibacillus sp. GP183]|uniref:hypothetical protein n=1 Tax=Paenibacillus sp. GP183 TaxID=1882751 RepID=UPI000899C819|nr:hypothetical protein [Paenibacillus sp. GP183]SEC04262.1 hypothetical protein SAMN05443246_2771 [Paenibacillus sp. GP183]
MKNVLITSYILLIFVLSACGSREKNTESTISVTPGVSPSLSSTLIPIVVPTETPITSVMPSEKPSPNVKPTETVKSTVAPSKTPTVTEKPSPIAQPTATPKVSLPINESIMSKSKRQELTADGKEIVAFLDAYLHYYNLHAKSFVDGYDFNSIDALSRFGDGVISFKVLDKPVFKPNQHAELDVHVEIKHNAKDDTPYLNQDCLFIFSNHTASEGWQLQYMFN